MTVDIEATFLADSENASALGKRKFAGSDDPNEDASDASQPEEKGAKGAPMTKARQVRLEQNRKAARESRRRKKMMIEELQRSVIFFSRANNTLKNSNEELSRLLIQAQAQIANDPDGEQLKVESDTKKDTSLQEQQQEAQTVATQAMYESQGYPAAAARAAAQAVNGGMVPILPAPAGPSGQSLPPMQPGATMQAMANFQQAAAAAMQNAIGQMQGIGVSTQQFAAAPIGANTQQAYTDTMTALALQQAANNAAGYGTNPAWQGGKAVESIEEQASKQMTEESDV